MEGSFILLKRNMTNDESIKTTVISCKKEKCSIMLKTLPVLLFGKLV